MRRSTTGSGTTITVDAFGLEEHSYSGTGVNTSNTFYYLLDDRLVGEATGITSLSTQFFLTDTLGSVLTTFSTSAGSAAVVGNQLYGPYGNQRYSQGVMGTMKGYTGQYADATGLDYYNARYYDPVVGVFLSPDTEQDNLQGFNPYAYVEGNPETKNDPTGHFDTGGDPFLKLFERIAQAIAIGIAIVSAGIGLAKSAIDAGQAIGNFISQAGKKNSNPNSGSAKPVPTPQATPSTSNAGANCKKSPNCSDLSRVERNGQGHTISNHVTIADPQKAADASGKAVSKFLSLAIAQKAVDNVLTRAEKGLKPGQSGVYWVFADINVGFPVGFIYQKGKPEFTTSQVTIVISPMTDTIFTAYPSHTTIKNDYRPG